MRRQLSCRAALSSCLVALLGPLEIAHAQAAGDPPSAVAPASAPPTSAPPTSAPPISAPPTSAPPTSAPPAPDALTPPRLLAFVDAGYPDEARAEPREAAVLLVLTIGADGFVEQVDLTGPELGSGFDAAAIAAARRFVFEPATRGGEPVRARVQFRYDFAPPPPEAQGAPVSEPAPAPAPRGALELALRDQQTDKPLAGVEVLITPSDGSALSTRLVSGEDGKAKTGELPAGRYTITLAKAEYASETHDEDVPADQVTSVTYRLSTNTLEGGYGAVARVASPPREVTRRTIERGELMRAPGTRGDALRTIELLPGVSRPPFGSGLVLIRGSAPGDSQVFLNGVPVPILYHFGGLTSFINSRALERIEFYPGNFSVKYGRQIGGIIDVGVRDPASDGYHAVLDTNLPIDSSLLVEGPITKKVSFLVAGRRSYIGEILTAVLPSDAFSSFAAPSYSDYQGIITYKPTARDKLRLAAYGSTDRLDVLFANVPDDDPTISGIELKQRFHRQQIGWTRQYSSRLDHAIEVSSGQIYSDFGAGRDIRFNLAVNNVYARAEWRYRVREALQLTFGTDTFVDKFNVKFQGPPPPQSEGDTSSASVGDRPNVRVQADSASYAPALYAELAIRPTSAWRIVPGLRLDYFGRIRQFAFDPRIAVIYSLTPKLRLKGGVGLFSQLPQYQETASLIGTRNLLPIRAAHYSAGVEHDLPYDISVNMEGFYKRIERRVVSREADDPNPQPFNNDGIGRIYGLEVQGKKRFGGRWFGTLAYTLMRSERKDHDDSSWYLFDFDQTHIFTLASSVQLGRGFELGGVVRLISGNPNTPVIGGVQSLNSGSFSSLSGPVNSDRNPMFRRIDVRLEKKWVFDKWRLAFYIDVQNATNAKNQEGISYNFNFKERARVTGVPIIPAIGLRGEL